LLGFYLEALELLKAGLGPFIERRDFLIILDGAVPIA
jgi:hypothetical protein